MKPVIIFCHVPRTGGSTIAKHLMEHMPDRYWHNEWKRPEEIQNTEVWQGHFLIPEDHVRIWGQKRAVRYMTILRDPVTWLQSVYNMHVTRTPEDDRPFIQWYRDGGKDSVYHLDRRKDAMTTWFEHQFCKGEGFIGVVMLLERCWFVSVTDHLSEDLPALFRYLGVPEKARKQRVSGEVDEFDGRKIHKAEFLSAIERLQIYRENPLDCQFYWEALRRRRETVQGIRERLALVEYTNYPVGAGVEVRHGAI